MDDAQPIGRLAHEPQLGRLPAGCLDEPQAYTCFNKGDEVAIKIHYGEHNRTAILRPEYIAAIVACGGHPMSSTTRR
jgi:uncharacterized Fe-S center protein